MKKTIALMTVGFMATAALARTRPVVLTWGLLGPEKGIDSAIAA